MFEPVPWAGLRKHLLCHEQYIVTDYILTQSFVAAALTVRSVLTHDVKNVS